MLVHWAVSIDNINTQIDFGNTIWLQSFVSGVGKTVKIFAKSIQHAKSTGCVQKPTLACNAAQAQSSRHTMGYQIPTGDEE
jgi:hypothetical protein